MGWLLPLGSRKVMGSFAGYSVSVSTFEIVQLFFNGFFFGFFQRLFLLMLRFDGLLFWTFFSMTEDLAQFALHIPFNFSSTSRLPGCHFFLAALSTFSDTRRLSFLWPTRSCFIFPVPEEDLWCLKKTHDAWRSVAKLSTREDMVLDVDTKSPA